MNAVDVLGFVSPYLSIVCVDCAPPEAFTSDEWSPIFAESETDCPSHCAECEALIPENLTSDGVRYVREHLRRFLRTHGREGRAEILSEWAATFEVPGARYFLRRFDRY